MKTFIETSEITDDIKYMDIGIEDKMDFFTFTLEALGLSYMDNFPKSYKFAGFSIIRNLDAVQYARATYDILACIGDIGGLEGIILMFGGFLISRITSFLVTV